MNQENSAWNRDLLFTLTANGQVVNLAENPVGWDEAFIKWERSEKYYGLFRSYAQNLTFVKQGAHFLRYLFYATAGRVGAECTLTVKKRNRQTMAWDTLFLGDIDFYTFNDSQEGVKVTIVEGGLSKWVKLNETTEYTIAIPNLFVHDWGSGSDYYSCLQYYYLFGIILDKITEGRIVDGTFLIDYGPFDLYSPDGLGLDYALTTGLCIRHPDTFYPETKYIKLKFADVLSDIIKMFSVGYYIKTVGGKETFCIDYIENIFDPNTEVFDLGEVSGFSLNVEGKMSFKKLTAGYSTPTYEDNTVYHEVNTQSVFTTERKNTTNDFDLKIKYRADYRGMRQTYDNGIADESNDAEIWNISLYLPEGYAYYQLKDGWLTQDGGLTANTIYNYRISPAHIIQRWQKYLNSCMDGMDSTGLTLESFDFDNNINETSETAIPAAVWLKEAYDTLFSGDRLFLPYLIRFVCPAGYDFFQALTANPLGYITFVWNQHTFRGFLLSGSVSVAEKTVIDFTLLSHPDNDLSTLVRR